MYYEGNSLPAVAIVATIIYYALLVFSFVMWARLILDFARSFVPAWRPAGPVLVIAELVFSTTDPPIRFVRRFVPPVRFGGLTLDLSWSIVMLVVIIATYATFLFR